MNIKYSGAVIEFENDAEFTSILNMVCVCGHRLSEHAFYTLPNLNQVMTSQCVPCGIGDNKFVCSQFKVSNG